ncbi:unnamed protein product [Brachionus calyciflorus]|uniref:Uncharacterized protein n=1 Tax=Brachionus calyciflorus TaxID=104777 RepID=A0A813SV90_9BILA|nr:unnamed protein product [Brachionus calyciflorus]
MNQIDFQCEIVSNLKNDQILYPRKGQCSIEILQHDILNLKMYNTKDLNFFDENYEHCVSTHENVNFLKNVKDHL